MKKGLKYFLCIALVASLILNLITIKLLSNSNEKLNYLEFEMDKVSSSVNSLEYDINSLETQITRSNQFTKENEAKDFMSPSELADYLDVHIKTIYETIIDNPDSDFPYIKLNGEVRFNRKVVNEYMLKKATGF